MRNKVLCDTLLILMQQQPDAWAEIKGGPGYPEILGTAAFYPLWRGTLVLVSVSGLPQNASSCPQRFYGFHLHEGNSCTGSTKDPFSDAGLHWNPSGCLHPNHAGDFPPLIVNDGYAFEMFYTDQFFPEEIVGKTVIIHDMPDDFSSQPSGNSGTKIACGEVFTKTSL